MPTSNMYYKVIWNNIKKNLLQMKFGQDKINISNSILSAEILNEAVCGVAKPGAEVLKTGILKARLPKGWLSLNFVLQTPAMTLIPSSIAPCRSLG